MTLILKVASALLFGLVIGAGTGLLFAFPTMWLWNYLMPDLFGLKVIGFEQALCMNMLSGMLFKSSCSSGTGKESR